MAMLCGLTHVLVPVSSLDRAEAFYCRSLGFALVARGDGWMDLDAAGFHLRLTTAAIHPVTLRLQTTKVLEVAERIRRHGARWHQEPRTRGDRLLEAQLLDPFGNVLVLWRPLGEDERERPPELPVSSAWEERAIALLSSLLQRVPQEFRDLARSGSVREAERLAQLDESVSELLAVRAFVRATPRLLRDNLREALVEHGWDPRQLAEDFDA